MSYFTYKILIDPKTFDSFVREITVPSEYGECPLGKRDMTDEEVEAKWTEYRFIEVLSEYGYGHAAVSHIENHNLFKE